MKTGRTRGEKGRVSCERPISAARAITHAVEESSTVGREWTKLDNDRNEAWVAVRSEEGEVDNWVDLRLSGEVCQKAGL